MVGGSARWIKIGPLPAVHPAEFMKLALVVYLAHWFAKRGTAVHGLLVGHAAVPRDHGARWSCSSCWSRTSARRPCSAFTAFTMFFLAGANLLHLVGMAAAAVPAVFFMFMQGYQMDRITAWLNPWRTSPAIGFHSVQGFFALALGGVLGAGLGESRLAGGLFLPNAFNDFIFAIIGEEFGLLGAGLVIVLFLAIGYLGIRTGARGTRTRSVRCWRPGSRPGSASRPSSTSAVVVGLIPVTGIPLPFVSAGGSSLVISFAAIGILLSVSRETVEKGTWNDAPADRGRGDGRSHLPGPRRRPIASRTTRRA